MNHACGIPIIVTIQVIGEKNTDTKGQSIGARCLQAIDDIIIVGKLAEYYFQILL